MEYGTLTPDQQANILSLAHAAEKYDGVSPLNEEATLAISHGTGRHLLAQDASELLGYAYADDGDSVAQIVVDPPHRRHGLATHLVAHLAHPDLWAFGNGEPAQCFCASQGYAPVRGILVMERQLPVILPEAGSPFDSTLAAPGGGVFGASHLNPCLGLDRMSKLLLRSTCVGVGSHRGRPPLHEGDPDCVRMTSTDRITTFVPSDLDNLVHLNARSFADHPEQGQMTRNDFTARMESDWFDPEGLLIARDEHDTMIGFHWTKVENGVGEVYVLGVDPDHAGVGVGTQLLNAGLTYLASRHVTTVRLWVDDDNHIAQSLYMESGFSPIRHDIRYRSVDEEERHIG